MDELLRITREESRRGTQSVSGDASFNAFADTGTTERALHVEGDEAVSPEAEADPAPRIPVDQAVRRKIVLIHRNLGHPSKEVLLKMLKDAGAEESVLEQARMYDCPECLQRGRRAPLEPATPPHYTQKWEDTFWWHTPKQALQDGQSCEHMLCLSMMDEATDFHVVHVVKTSREGRLHNITGPEFRHAFGEAWLKILPAPKVLRYDEEGFMKRVDVIGWLEAIGIRLEPVAGEAPWQVGKHSRHLQTVKENLNLLRTELRSEASCKELVALAMSAKNGMHQIRGYSPNQWAFGQDHKRITSFLQQGDHLPTVSAREEETFEQDLQRQLRAQKLFLEVDARRRKFRALRAGSRPLREFRLGELVYYYKRGRKQGSRYEGHWYGPARVLCHEHGGVSEQDGASGSVVWVSHAGTMLRCSPKQLRRVTRDLQALDADINGPRTFHSMLEKVSQQQRYIDLTREGPLCDEAPKTLDEEAPRFRVRGKQPPADESMPDAAGEGSSEPSDVQILPPQDLSPAQHGSQSADQEGARGNGQGAPRAEGGASQSERTRLRDGHQDVEPPGPGGIPHQSGQAQGKVVPRRAQGRGLHQVGDRSRRSADGAGNAATDGLPASASDTRPGIQGHEGGGIKRRISQLGQNQAVMSRSPDDHLEVGSSTYDTDMETWNRIDETEAALSAMKYDVGHLNNRMDKMESVLTAILAELQMQRAPAQ